MTQPKSQDTNGLAVTSLILGVLSLTGFGLLTAIPAIITGVIGLRNPEGKGMSLAGVIMGSVSAVVSILIFVLIMALLFAGFFAASSYDASGDPGYVEEGPSFDMPQRI